VNLIVANLDNYFILTNRIGVIGNILLNDTLNGVVTNFTEVDITSNASTLRFLTINPNGDILVDGTQTAGTYAIDYYICEIANPLNCSTPASITITVT
jgi:hypothetical protein